MNPKLVLALLAGALLGLCSHFAPWRRRVKKCISCGSCARNCPTAAISRVEIPPGDDGVAYKYVSDDNKCIACGFCADTCPCGIWVLRPF